VRWYFRYRSSPRDIEALLFGRGVAVSYETIHRWYEKFGARFADRVNAARCKSRGTWHLDEMSVTLRGEPCLLCRVVDERGAELNLLLQGGTTRPPPNGFSSICRARSSPIGPRRRCVEARSGTRTANTDNVRCRQPSFL
jgi:putative transposase